MTDLLNKIHDRSAHIGVVGLGYIGLPLAVEFAKAGFPVTGIDVDRVRVDAIRKGESYIQDVSSTQLRQVVAGGRLQATVSFDGVGELDTISICVPTPLKKTKDPDISNILDAVRRIAPHLRRGQLIVLESTTYPGTTDELVLPELSAGGLAVGRDFYLAFSPERTDPGNAKYQTKNTPKIIGGVTSACAERAVALYRAAIDTVIPVSSARAAEMVKLLENTFRAINIGLANEVAIMCDKLGVDVWEVIEAAATKPFGFMPFYPGPGLGGHCIPVDPHYLSWKLKALNYNARFIELASEINGAMPAYVVSKVADALNERKKSLNGAKILVLGVAYKRDVTDFRESPALDVISLLLRKHAQVSYNDPFVPELTYEDLQLRSVALEDLDRYDCILIATDHSQYPYDRIVKEAPLIVDARNATRNVTSGREKIVRL